MAIEKWRTKIPIRISAQRKCKWINKLYQLKFNSSSFRNWKSIVFHNLWPKENKNRTSFSGISASTACRSLHRIWLTNDESRTWKSEPNSCDDNNRIRIKTTRTRWSDTQSEQSRIHTARSGIKMRKHQIPSLYPHTYYVAYAHVWGVCCINKHSFDSICVIVCAFVYGKHMHIHMRHNRYINIYTKNTSNIHGNSKHIVIRTQLT